MASIKESISSARRSKKFMTWLLVGIITIIVLLYFFGGFDKRSKNILIGTGIVAAGALGLEVFDYDLDLQTLWDTGSIQDSRVQNAKGVRLVGDCVKADAADDLNCDNFETQGQAQSTYQKCVDRILQYNSDLDNEGALKLDVYGLDGNKNGIVCEHLPAGN